MHSLISHEFKFNMPTVKKSSREYFCYISLMDGIASEYDVITLKKDGYYILDITQNLNIEKLFEVEKMSAITPLEFIRFLVEQGHTFQIAFMDDDEVGEEIIEVNKDNFEEFAKRMEEKTCHS